MTTAASLHPPLAPIKVRSWLSKAIGLLVGMTVVNAGNYALNLVLGRLLDPPAFAAVTLVSTLLLVAASGGTAVQVAVAKFVAEHEAAGDTEGRDRLVKYASTKTLHTSLALFLVLLISAPYTSRLFQMPGTAPILWFVAALPPFLLLCVGRGVHQGKQATSLFMRSFHVEMIVRFGLSVALVFLGFGATGACFAVLASVVFSLLVAIPRGRGATPENAAAFRQFIVTAMVAQVAIAIFKQADVFVVKARFSDEMAGQFSAILLAGRVVFFATLSVVSAMFPAVSAKALKKEPHGHLAVSSLGLVLAVGAPLVLIAYAWPEASLRLLFGEKYLGLAGALGFYTLGALGFALANVLVDYNLAQGNKAPALISIAFGITKTAFSVTLATTIGHVVALHAIFSFALFFVLCSYSYFRRHAQT